MRKFVLRLLRLSSFTSNVAAFYGLWSQQGFLGKRGWFRTFHKLRTMEADGQPLPWFTYASIDFLGPRLNRKMAIFEYGSGQSTLWWSKRVGTVNSVEHDRAWYEKMASQLPDAVEYRYADLDNGEYVRAIREHDNKYDIVVIDGRERVACAKESLAALKPDGVIVWDNSDRPRYEEGGRFLEEQGFKRIDFWGMGPLSVHGWSTSVFYRPGNCLNI